jgi:hypothetical protein
MRAACHAAAPGQATDGIDDFEIAAIGRATGAAAKLPRAADFAGAFTQH